MVVRVGDHSLRLQDHHSDVNFCVRFYADSQDGLHGRVWSLLIDECERPYSRTRPSTDWCATYYLID